MPDAGCGWMPLTVLCVSEGVGSSREAREFVRETLQAPVLGKAVVADAVQAVSELVTNAMLHGGYVAKPHIQVKVVAIDMGVRIEVYDVSVVAPVECTVSDDAERGRGLAIVAALADRWGWEPTTRGKYVWCELAARPEQTTTHCA